MADIYFKCACGKNLAIDESGAGRTVTCPDCGRNITVPGPELEWNCPRCAARMRAPAAMRGASVQCLGCQSLVQAPDNGPPAAEPEPGPAGPGENLSARLNQFFKECPQCHERIPIHANRCAHCDHDFAKPAARSSLAWALCALVVVGVLLGIWRMGFRPFRAKATPSPAPPAAAPASPAAAGAPAVSHAAVAEPVAAVAPTAQVAAAELPTNITAVIPVVTNIVKAAEWKTWVAASRQALAARLDKDYPRRSAGQPVSLRQLNGVVVHGTNAGCTADGCNLEEAGQTVFVAFRDLDVYDRLRMDDRFRATWLDNQAWTLSRRLLEEQGLKLPVVSSNAPDAVAQAVALGDASAQFQLGQQYLKQKDYAYAFLYMRAAAQSNAAAQYTLGMLFYQGVGTAADRQASWPWLALAAAQGHAKAEQFLQQHNVSPEARQKLLQQDKAARERDAREIERVLQNHRNRPPAAGAAGPAGPAKESDP